jgi:hypothetical protein
MMGLDISLWESVKGGFRAGSYSGFGNWRTKLAESVGIYLNQMQGFTENGTKWSGHEPFYELLYHSDCDGVLWWDECENLLEDFGLYRDKFIKYLSDEGITELYYLEKYDSWFQIIKKCVEIEGMLRFG